MTLAQEARRNEKVEVRQTPILSSWSNRFIWAAIIQGLAATLLTIPIVWPSGLLEVNVTPAVAQVIAAGSAGTWFLVGYVLYIVVGVIAVGLTALFYHHFEIVMNKPYRGIANYFAWIHLFLMNIGAAAATWMLMYAGYFGERAIMATSSGGLGWTAEQAHVSILEPLVTPIGVALIVTGLGVLAGGAGFLITYFRR